LLVVLVTKQSCINKQDRESLKASQDEISQLNRRIEELTDDLEDADRKLQEQQIKAKKEIDTMRLQVTQLQKVSLTRQQTGCTETTRD
jgi:hypothetical protein